ncbi:hypothetical protein NE237_028062 [Protea cynaroides]|uniref:Uncharacterized protein n=1 Tax=Protea cynaroides TaxID=273540 RepID=A0A9Q0JUS8_9MAGN|nr:hypothetical protein NE237_028062 [Protea cynaroides]
MLLMSLCLSNVVHTRRSEAGKRNSAERGRRQLDIPRTVDEKRKKNVKAPNLIRRAKKEIEATMNTERSSHHHHKETHGKSDDIDENTPIDEVKGPSVFHRAKEEIEAIYQTVQQKKESDSHNHTSKKEGGFLVFIGRCFEKFCSPWDKKTN